MKAFKLININGTDSSFLEGTIPELKHVNANYFFIQTKVEEISWHPAPRYQFAITLKGTLKFTVTNGDTFIVEPGDVVIANDLLGKGHKWEIIDGNEWHRIYIVPDANDDDYFESL
jgi:quercetin dioxygenase-like cupin family protein